MQLAHERRGELSYSTFPDEIAPNALPSVRLVSEEGEIRMKRIATRTLALFATGLFVLGTAAACASEDTSGSPFKAPPPDGGKSTSTRVCMVMYCPMPAGGKACCLPDGTCGVDPGNGCVPLNKKDGGP